MVRSVYGIFTVLKFLFLKKPRLFPPPEVCVTIVQMIAPEGQVEVEQ